MLGRSPLVPLAAVLIFLAAAAAAQAPLPAPSEPPGPATALYLRLRSVGLDAARVYTVRDAVLDRDGVQFIFNDGVIAFTEAVEGRITGAFFEGDGEILLSPPDQVERASLARFTGAPILTENFSSAYLRFNDDSFGQLEPYLWKSEDREFVGRWDAAARTLAEPDALRLLLSFTNQPPHPLDGSAADESPQDSARFLHARLTGETLGTFEIRVDALVGESVSAGQASWHQGAVYYDLWTSFPGRSRRTASTGREVDSGFAPEAQLRVLAYRLRAEVKPPTRLEAEAELDLEVRGAGRRTLGFELSRYLQVQSVTADGQPLEIIQNEALRGSELARRGNDIVAVVFPQPIEPGRKLTLRFRYGGEVLSGAGGGLLYVGARGTWFPNRGLTMGEYEMEFRYPAEWTLVATGRRVALELKEGVTTSRWVSDRPIPLAGFNLGRYESARAQAAGAVIETYAARSVEDAFPRSSILVRPPGDPRLVNLPRLPVSVPLAPPQPARNAQQLADRTARTLEFLSRRLGPFPYRQLSLTQMPGRNSQGWPGLIFLSSYAFLTPDERARAGLDAIDAIQFGHITPAHETAHQWFGDLILWRTYRDQWMVEALCNYLALLELEEQKPEDFRKLMDFYRDELLRKSAGGAPYAEAGPVTLGLRLSSSKFPDGYDVVAYGRGTWLFHMLRHLLRDAAGAASDHDAAFFQVLRRLRERHEGRDLSTADLQKAFEEVLPPALRFEGRASLDWFFDGWVRGPAVPRFELAGVRFERRGAKNFVVGKIVQKNAPDQLITSVPLYAQASKGAPVFLGRVFADGPETEFRIPAPGNATRLLLDPHATVLRRP